MKLVSFSHQGRDRFGRVVNEHFIADLTDAFGDLRSVLERDQLPAVRDADGPHIAFSDVTLLAPVTNAQKYFCIGVNYANRNAEYKDGSEPPKFPSVFMRSRESFVGHNVPLERPPESDKLDYEGEIVIIIGKAGRRIDAANWADHVAGFSLMNEGTLRDWVRHAKFNVTQGKNFERSGAIGPWMITTEEFLKGRDVNDLQISTRVNGELRQDDTTANMMFPIPFIVSYLSSFARLQPGDVIATGTPNGAGARFDPPKYLVPGDVVEVHCDGIGTLSNGVIDEPDRG
ncbi:fumarylacetoacetate hydrolase family protein [Algimonas porphyrae]|uniref:2-hydroxyhepta-2,4-diene-1,7-dioate isomerase n=1 Tax=Algimonas porphyrae TaxID=1128113 RepID=A0ABQ5V380_9PROT|nr:fumarylacetoacetate hydrolase family protein [Algimonas porphyrae]GLQ21507.1 2-hydroxyhepta-2,4-diene-1,7-dioate isomerase [Algimonas porphyrae]